MFYNILDCMFEHTITKPRTTTTKYIVFMWVKYDKTLLLTLLPNPVLGTEYNNW